jgi:solute carrier family 25 protein 16
MLMHQFQVQALSSSSLVGTGTFESLVMIVKQQGWRQLFSGLSINYLKVRYSPFLTFKVY